MGRSHDLREPADAARTRQSRQRSGTLLLLALALSIAIRAAWSWYVAGVLPEAVITPDTPEYLGSAKALLSDGHFWTAPGSGIADFRRTPGYPLFLAGLLAVRDDLRWVAAAQSVITGLLPLATYFLARRLVSRRAALLASIIVALDPLLFVAGGTLMTEALAAVSMLAFIAIAWAMPDRASTSITNAWLFGVGTALAVATHVRPTTYYFAPVLIGLVAFRLRPRGRAAAATGVLAVALPLVLLIGGWQWRNHEQVGTWRFTSIEAVNLYGYRGAGVIAEVEGIPFLDARERLGLEGDTCPEWWDGSGCPSEAERGAFYNQMAAEGARIILAHPAVAIRLTAEGALRMLFGPGLETVTDFATFVPRTMSTRVVLALWSVPTTLLAILGGALVVRHADPSKRRRWWLVILLVGYVVGVTAGTEAYARFRTPLVPLLALLVAGGFDAVSERRSRSD